MGCGASYGQKNQILQIKQEEIKLEIIAIEQSTNDLRKNVGPGMDIKQLNKRNMQLKRQRERLNKLKSQNEKLQREMNNLEKDNTKLTKTYHDMINKSTKSGALVLDHELWKPLNELIKKFNEFDSSGSGFIDRNEFHKLCSLIETELQISRIFSEQNQHSASSVYSNNKPGTGHNQGCIDSNQAWSAQHNNQQQWYQIDAVINIGIAGIIVQGRKNADQWIKSFKISYSKDGNNWTKLDKLFNANEDRDTKNRILFTETIEARYIRIHPISWHGHISGRFDILWLANYQQVKLKEKADTKSQFTFEEQDRLFDLFDLKGSGGIDVSEFLAVLDRETIRNPSQHPYKIIKQTMKYLLYGHVNIKQEDHIDMLGKTSKGYKYPENNENICCCCYYEPGIYGYNNQCKHTVCQECLKDSLKYIMDNGKFPAYCIGCKAEESMQKKQGMNLDILITNRLLRFWVEEELIDLKFAIRFKNQQNRFIQKLTNKDLANCSTMRKCTTCNLVSCQDDNDTIKCSKCSAEL